MWIKFLKKAVGPYSIPTEILKKVGGIIAKPLELLCNLSFSTGVVPDNLKIARVIPLYKVVLGRVCPIIVLYPCFQFFIRFLKSLFIIDL